MLKPPFKLATPLHVGSAPVTFGADGHGGVEMSANEPVEAVSGRLRLAQLDPHLHCSVIGTCLSAGELRKLMARFIDVHGADDLDVHHEAVRHAGAGGAAARALHKALDQRHETVLRSFTRAADTAALEALWDASLRQGEIAGAYWAVLTHRHVSPTLRQKAFGEVHMLSHLLGAANRADIRRLQGLKRDNAELRERLERQQVRSAELNVERDRALAELEQTRVELRQALQARPAAAAPRSMANAADAIAAQAERREAAERTAEAVAGEAERLRLELQHLREHALTLARELAVAETQLREHSEGQDPGARLLGERLRGRRILYVGGRPSSAPAIRDLVLRHGGELQRHDGGIEDRKGMLAATIAWADLVVFPVDCIDHDSASNLKRLCVRQGIRFRALRSAGVASFAAALAEPPDGPPFSTERMPGSCPRFG